MSKTIEPSDIIQFWFKEIDSALWWKKDLNFDALIIQRFSRVHQQACRGELYTWRSTAEGRLAEIIVLDQFSRNMFRDKKEAFAQDSLALILAQEVVSIGLDKALTQIQRSVLYLPFMHSESFIIHQVAEQLYEKLGITSSCEFELKHKLIIEKFGRYPHRNKILSRTSTEDEIEFLTQPNSSF
jgi:uncharacterized protein (DUF924 family)